MLASLPSEGLFQAIGYIEPYGLGHAVDFAACFEHTELMKIPVQAASPSQFKTTFW